MNRREYPKYINQKFDNEVKYSFNGNIYLSQGYSFRAGIYDFPTQNRPMFMNYNNNYNQIQHQIPQNNFPQQNNLIHNRNLQLDQLDYNYNNNFQNGPNTTRNAKNILFNKDNNYQLQNNQMNYNSRSKKWNKKNQYELKETNSGIFSNESSYYPKHKRIATNY